MIRFKFLHFKINCAKKSTLGSFVSISSKTQENLTVFGLHNFFVYLLERSYSKVVGLIFLLERTRLKVVVPIVLLERSYQKL